MKFSFRLLRAGRYNFHHFDDRICNYTVSLRVQFWSMTSVFNKLL